MRLRLVLSARDPAFVQEVERWREAGGDEDRFRCASDLKPGGDIGGMIRARLEIEAEIGGEEGSSYFRHELLLGVAGIAPALAPEFTVEPGRVPGPVDAFVPKGGVAALGVAERLEGRHLHVTAIDGVEGLAAAVAHVGVEGREEDSACSTGCSLIWGVAVA